MKSFSERKGLKSVRSSLQIDSMDDDLRNSLWNALTDFYWDKIDQMYKADDMFSINPRYASDYPLVRGLWSQHLRKRIDEMDTSWGFAYDKIAKYFFSCKWNEVYDFVQFVANFNVEGNAENCNSFMSFCNSVLERESSGYRFVGGVITEVTAEEEIREIEEASALPFAPVARHIKRALALMSDKKSPDYRNSIKESISAVEAACRLIARDKATFGKALKKVKGKVPLHPALVKAFGALYGYASTEDGIRHSFIDEKGDLDFGEAKFMLVSCSAFVNYLFYKSSNAGMTLVSP